LEVLDEADGVRPRAWRHATIFRHKSRMNDVLWFGDDDFEGLGGTYRWEGTSRTLVDSDGMKTTTQKAKRFTPKRSAGGQGEAKSDKRPKNNKNK
jgi:hypothetical protein